MGDNPSGWPIELTRRIGTAISDARTAQNMSVVKLAARTTELGYSIHRVAISKLESGERAITVPELVILAAALNTVPLALLLPRASDDKIEILPSNEMPGPAAIGWFTGTTGATPDGVTRDGSMTSRLALTMSLNEVEERLGWQRHSLLQAEHGPKVLQMPEGLKAQMDVTAQRAREMIESLEKERDSIIHALTRIENQDGG